MPKPEIIFEALTRSVLSRHFGVALVERLAIGLKKFDLVSDDGAIIGDAKFFSLVNGKSQPPAKRSVIAEHVWLLEKSTAHHRFLVFGNDSRVAAGWLMRYGRLATALRFFFVDEAGLREYDHEGSLGPVIAALDENERAIVARLRAAERKAAPVDDAGQPPSGAAPLVMP